MTLDILSSIKGAEASEAVDNLFKIMKEVKTEGNATDAMQASEVTIDGLRDDVVIPSPAAERNIIIEDFPKSKNGYLVVTKVIED